MSAAAPAVAAAGTGGLSALLWPMLMSFGPSLLGKLFGGDPQKELRKRVARMTSPASIASLTNQFYQQILGSPAYSQAQGQIAGGANVAGSQIAQNLAARGIGTSGTGAIMSGLMPSLVGSQMAGLKTSAYGQAGTQAKTAVEQALAALYGTQGPSQSQQMLGTGLEAFGPFFKQWLKSKYPGVYGGGGGLPTELLNAYANAPVPMPGLRKS